MRSQLASPEGTLIDRRLDNGGRLIAVVRPDIAYAVAGFWLKVGSAADEPSKEGTAHLWEHLAPLHPHGDATAQIAIERLGGLLSPETGRDFMAFPIATADASLLPTMLSLLRDALLTPPNSAALLEREKTLMRLEMRALWDDPLWVGKTLLEARLFANTPYAHPPSGWLHRLDHLTLDDVRRFHATHCVAENLALVAIVPDERLLSELETVLASLPSGQKVPSQTPSPFVTEMPEVTFPKRSHPDEGVLAIGWRLPIKAGERRWLDALAVYWRSVALPTVAVSEVREWRLVINPTRIGCAISVALRCRPLRDERVSWVVEAVRKAMEAPPSAEFAAQLRERLRVQRTWLFCDPMELARQIAFAWALDDDPHQALKSDDTMLAEGCVALQRRLSANAPTTITLR
ncbi:MAG: hypothetical protein XFASWVDF_001641 [Candidatus Fervidibacter sp.]